MLAKVGGVWASYAGDAEADDLPLEVAFRAAMARSRKGGMSSLQPAERRIVESCKVLMWGYVAEPRFLSTRALKNNAEVDVMAAEEMAKGTDGALACAVMHVLFKDGYADRDYLAKYTDDPAALEQHLASRTPEWAAAITGCMAWSHLMAVRAACCQRIPGASGFPAVSAGRSSWISRPASSAAVGPMRPSPPAPCCPRAVSSTKMASRAGIPRTILPAGRSCRWAATRDMRSP